MAGRSRQALTQVREGAVGPPGGPGGVGKPIRRTGRFLEPHPKARMGLAGTPESPEGPPGGPGRVRRPTRRCKSSNWRRGRGQESHPEERKTHPDIWEG